MNLKSQKIYVLIAALLAIILLGVALVRWYTGPLQGQSRGRTNIRIYGLTANGIRTDTIILASYYWEEAYRR